MIWPHQHVVGEPDDVARRKHCWRSQIWPATERSSVSCLCKIILSWKKLVFFLFITVSPSFDSSSFSCFSHCHFNSSVIIVYIYTLSSPNPRSYFHQISLLFSLNKFRVSGLEFSTLFMLFFYVNKPM